MNMDQLKQFAEFLEFLTNPEANKKLLADLQAATAENKKAYQELVTAKDFQIWRNKEIAKLEKKEKAIELASQESEMLRKQNEEFLVKESNKLNDREQVVVKRENEVEQRMSEWAFVVDARATLERERMALREKEDALATAVAEFDKKKAALNALMGT